MLRKNELVSVVKELLDSHLVAHRPANTALDTYAVSKDVVERVLELIQKAPNGTK